MKFKELSRSHDREGFDCGVRELNHFLKTLALQNVKKGLSRTFVLVEEDSPDQILGFFTLSLFELSANTLPRQYAKKYKGKIPAAKLARLAVSQSRQKQGLGKRMIFNAIKRVLLVSEQAGIIGFFVDAKGEQAKLYYKKFGFTPLPAHPLTLFLPISTLRQI